MYSILGWLGGAKVLCILHHWGVQLILAYSWARPAILVVGKGRGGMFLFLLFLHFHSCSSFFPVPLFHLLYSLLPLFSLSLGDDTKWPSRVDVSLNPNTIKCILFCVAVPATCDHECVVYILISFACPYFFGPLGSIWDKTFSHVVWYISDSVVYKPDQFTTVVRRYMDSLICASSPAHSLNRTVGKLYQDFHLRINNGPIKLPDAVVECLWCWHVCNKPLYTALI